MDVRTIKTPLLRQAYEVSGPKRGEPLLLLHGWPDSPRTWDKVLSHFHQAGYRTIAPYLRGYGPSHFRSRLFGRNPRRTGQPIAYAQDMINLADGLGLQRFHFIGHDWGAMAGYALAALYPKRLKSLVAISVPFQPGRAEPPAYPQVRAFWYQWLLCSKPGDKIFRDDPVAYGRAQWNAWSPAGWYHEHEFQEAAKSWHGEDFKNVVLHAYRSRWGHAQLDPHYDRLQGRFEATKALHIPTMLLHGEEDQCELLQTTEGAECYFDGDYHRVLLAGVGHFPTREQPNKSAEAILEHLRINRKR